ncbi:hypothetical protein VNO77_46381 [Canavalia gladiata]|uniref:Uncharacterized protein n=1 Tax=Canavalia gladiata TaxID=3824 RepID=A0AAN9PHP1_CANGL
MLWSQRPYEIVMSFTRSKPGPRAVRKIGRNLSGTTHPTLPPIGGRPREPPSLPYVRLSPHTARTKTPKSIPSLFFHSTSPLQSSIKLAFPRRYEMGKSLISHQGSAEFAKRFRVRNLSQDISPISIRALMNSHHPYGTMAVQLQYPMKRFSTLCREPKTSLSGKFSGGGRRIGFGLSTGTGVQQWIPG